MLHEHRSPPAVGMRGAEIKTHREPRGDRTCLSHRIVRSCRFLELLFSFVVQTKPRGLPDALVVQIITLTSTPSKLITASPSWEIASISAAFMHLKLDSFVSAQTTVWTCGPAANYRQVFDCTACFISLSRVNICFKRPRSKTARLLLFTEITLSFFSGYNCYCLLSFSCVLWCATHHWAGNQCRISNVPQSGRRIKQEFWRILLLLLLLQLQDALELNY